MWGRVRLQTYYIRTSKLKPKFAGEGGYVPFLLTERGEIDDPERLIYIFMPKKNLFCTKNKNNV